MPSLTEWSRRHPDAAAAVALFVLPFLLLGRALWPGRVLSPADGLLSAPPWSGLAPGFVPGNPQLTDVTLALHPFLLYAWQEIARGHFPLWNPYAFAGVPFFANPNTALLFPLTALGYVLPAAVALTLMSILKLSIAGLGMYWFLRGLPTAPLPALTGAVAFMLSGQLIVWLQYTVGTTVIFLPLLFGVVDRLRRDASRRWAPTLALVVALDVFAGYPQGAFLGVAAATAWAVYRAGSTAAGIRFLLRFVAGVTLGLGLAAVQIFPFIEYMRESAVLAYRTEWLPLLALPFRAAMTFLMPYYYGSPTGRDYWGDWNFNEMAGSVGLVPLVVLPVALIAGWRRSGTRFFLGLGGLAAAGQYGLPLVSEALAAIPGLSLVVNLRLGLLVAFPLCALCAIGLDALTAGLGDTSRWSARAAKAWCIALVAIAFGVLADDYASLLRVPLKVSPFAQYAGFLVLFTAGALTVLKWLRRRGPAGRLGAVLLALELATALPLAVSANPAMDARWLYPAPPSVQHLQRESGRSPDRVLLEANVPMLYGLADVSGYDGMTPARIERLIRPRRAVNLQSLTGNSYIGPAAVLASPLVDLFGVRRVVVPPGVAITDPRFALEYLGSDARVYRNERALPRAFLVGRARCVDDGEAAQLVARAAFDFREEVLLAECVQPEPVGPTAGGSGVEIGSYAPERVVIRATAGAPGYLVLTDAWFPGWRVWVDGAERPLRRADYAFRAVWLDRGTHEVEFRYRPAAFRWGLAVSALAAIVLALLLLRPRRRAIAAGAVAITLLILGAGSGEAALPRAPLDFSVSPSTVRQDERATVRLEPRGRAAAGAAFDVYVIWFVSGGVAFLAPDGAWSAQPVPILTGLTAGHLEPAVKELRPPARTVGSLPLAALFVRSGGEPLARPDWVYQPALRVVRLKASIAGDLGMGRAAGVLGGLGLLTLAACAAVAFYPRRRLSAREE